MQSSKTCEQNANLHVIAARGSVKNCVTAIQSGANINETDNLDWTPIMHAARNGHHHIVKLLHESGANILISNKYGYTPLSLAVAGDNEETFKYILEKMVVNSNKELEDKISFGLACFHGKTSVVKLCLSLNIFNLNAAVLYGMTPLLLAASNGQVETAKILISAGADRYLTNCRLQTSYDIAVYRRDTKMQALLSNNKFSSSPLNNHLIFSPSAMTKFPRSPLTPSNDRLKSSPLATQSVPIKIGNQKLTKKLDFDVTENSYGFLKHPPMINNSWEVDDEEHSYCDCHYLNSLLSPRQFYQNKVSRKKGVSSTDQNKKTKYLKIPWIKKKVWKSNSKDGKNLADKENRIKENLKITQLLTKVELEEYISTFIIQEIDADTILTLTEEDLINIGIDKNNCDEVIQKISKLI